MNPMASGEAKGPRVVVLCGDGMFQRAFAARAAREFELAGLVVQHPPPAQQSLSARLAKYRDPRRIARQVLARIVLPRFDKRGRALADATFGAAEWPAADRLDVEDINGADAVAFIERHRPDLILVNGTQLLREPVLALAERTRFGILNLHTGLSPYSRGGNCNLFMLLEGRPEMVGVTVHYIDRGIDSGDIVRTEQVPLRPDDCYETIDVRTFAVGIDATIDAAKAVVRGDAPRTPQWEEGKLFLRRTGYVYEPHHRVLANRLIRRGLLRDYLEDKAARDRNVRLVR
jgi:folate-dependent phosphoribosylglycinamide formyltransferase PurN